ncbi:MAG: protein kinase [Clostridiales bacterium]|nr:protein kinase [Clostridiales bacterium]
MIQVDGKNLCSYCFAEIPSGTENCVYCGSDKQNKVVPGALPPGTILHAQYIIGKTLGVGGFSITYRAFDYSSKKVVAIKEFFPSSLVMRSTGNTQVSVISPDDLNIYEKYLKRFYEEAHIISTLNHPNIIRVYKLFCENNTAYYVMEFLDGCDLNRYAMKKGGCLDESEVIFITACVAEALEKVHEKGLLHRDIAPDNIYMCNNGQVKLIDFGAARSFSMEGSRKLSIILKQGFAPMEQYKERGKQGPWTDIYALGATMVLCLNGRMPLCAADRIKYPELSIKCSHELEAVIKKMMAVQIQDRYIDIQSFKRDLYAVANGSVIQKEPDQDNSIKSSKLNLQRSETESSVYNYNKVSKQPSSNAQNTSQYRNNIQSSNNAQIGNNPSVNNNVQKYSYAPISNNVNNVPDYDNAPVQQSPPYYNRLPYAEIQPEAPKNKFSNFCNNPLDKLLAFVRKNTGAVLLVMAAVFVILIIIILSLL